MTGALPLHKGCRGHDTTQSCCRALCCVGTRAGFALVSYDGLPCSSAPGVDVQLFQHALQHASPCAGMLAHMSTRQPMLSNNLEIYMTLGETQKLHLAMTSSSSSMRCSTCPSALVMLAHMSAKRPVLSKSPPKAM